MHPGIMAAPEPPPPFRPAIASVSDEFHDLDLLAGLYADLIVSLNDPEQL